MSSLFIADPSDLATAEIDLDGWVEGDPLGFTLVRFRPGGVSNDATFLLGGEVAGGEQTAVQSPPVQGDIELTAIGPDLVSLREQLHLPLARALNANKVLVWYPEVDGVPLYDEPLYLDTYRSDIPPMFDDESRDGYFLAQGIDISYRFKIWHHPHPRSAGVNLANAVSVSNGLGGVNLVEVSNPGDTLSEGRLQLAVPGDEHVVWAMVGWKSGELEFPSYAMDDAEVVFDAWQMVHRQVLEPTDPAAFEGSYRLIVDYTGDADIFEFQVQYGTALEGPQGNAGLVRPVTHDWTEISVFHPVPLDLGIVRYDAQDPRLVIEIWCRSLGAGDVGAFSTVYLIPSDEACMEISAPGFLSGDYGLATYDGDSLVIGGGATVNDDGAINLEAGGTAFVASVYVDGNSYPIGRYNWELRGNVRNKDRNKEKEGELQVYVDGEFDASITANINSRRGEEVTRWDEDDRRHVSWDVTDPDVHYLEGVEFTEAGGPGKQIHIDHMRHSYIPWITGGRAMVIDQGRQIAFIADSDGGRIASLHRTAAFYLGPGPLTIAHLFGVQSPNRYEGVDVRGPLPLLEDVSVEHTTDVTPRTLHP